MTPPYTRTHSVSHPTHLSQVAASVLLYRSGQSGLLLLALPLAATQLLAVSASEEEAEGINVQKVLATTCVGVTYIVGFVGLPWHIVYPPAHTAD